MVEISGIEPLTSWMPFKRSPSWAIPPYLIVVCVSVRQLLYYSMDRENVKCCLGIFENIFWGCFLPNGGLGRWKNLWEGGGIRHIIPKPNPFWMRRIGAGDCVVQLKSISGSGAHVLSIDLLLACSLVFGGADRFSQESQARNPRNRRNIDILVFRAFVSVSIICQNCQQLGASDFPLSCWYDIIRPCLRSRCGHRPLWRCVHDREYCPF